jgi:hypothetical protein
MKKARRRETTTKATCAVVATNVPHALSSDDLQIVVGGDGLHHLKKPL